MPKASSIYTQTRKLEVVLYTSNPRILKIVARRSGVQGSPQLLNEFKVSLDHRKPCLKTKMKEKSSHQIPGSSFLLLHLFPLFLGMDHFDLQFIEFL